MCWSQHFRRSLGSGGTVFAHIELVRGGELPHVSQSCLVMFKKHFQSSHMGVSLSALYSRWHPETTSPLPPAPQTACTASPACLDGLSQASPCLPEHRAPQNHIDCAYVWFQSRGEARCQQQDIQLPFSGGM